jgi:uncharacterized membrane protein
MKVPSVSPVVPFLSWCVRRVFPGWAALIGLMGLVTSSSARGDAVSDALETPGLSWINSPPGGVGPWTVDTVTPHDGVDAMRSGASRYGWEAELKTTLTGPGTVVFWAKALTPGGSYLKAAAQASSLYVQNTDWRIYALDVPVGVATLSFGFGNFAPNGAQGDAVWVDQVSVADYSGQAPVVVGVPPSAVAGDADPQEWWAVVTGKKPFSGAWQHAGTNRFVFADVNDSRFGVNFQARPQEAGDWRLIITNALGFVVSDVFTLSVTSTPPHGFYVSDSFNSGLNPMPLSPGAALSLRVTAIGTEPFTSYQWRKDGMDLPGETRASLAFARFTAAEEGAYTCVVRNAVGPGESQQRTLSLSLAPPVVTTQPSSASLPVGAWLYSFVTAEGAFPIQYQWFKDDQVLPWATGQALSISGLVPGDTGIYRVRFSNANGEVWSDAVTISVDGGVPVREALEAPLLSWSTATTCPDEFGWIGQVLLSHDGADAAATAPLSSDRLCSLDLQTVVLGPAAMDFWWKLDGAADDELRVDVLDEFNTVIRSVARTGADGPEWTEIVLSVPAGTHTLRWRMTGGNATDGLLPRAWLDQVATQSLGEALDAPNLVWSTGSAGSVSGDPSEGWFYQKATTSDGADAAQSPALQAFGSSHVAMTINGPAVLEFQWFLAGDSDARIILSLDGMALPNVTVFGSTGPTRFETRRFLIPTGFHALRWDLSSGGQFGSPATAWLDRVNWSPGTANLARALDNHSVAWLGPGWTEDNTSIFTGGSGARSPVTPNDGTATLETSVLGLAEIRFDWAVDSQPGDTLRFYVDGMKEAEITGPTGFPRFREVVTVVGAGVHDLRWAYEKDAAGSAGTDASWVDNVRITPIQKPLITYGPPDVEVTEGRPIGLGLSAVSPEPMTYQWYHGAPLAGQVSEALLFASAQLSDAGSYYVVIANTFGSTTSRVAQLTVKAAPPIFTQPLMARWVYPRESVHIEVVATSPRPLTYSWQYSTNGFATTNVLQSGTSGAFDIASVAYEHSGTWRVVAMDVAGNASASTTAKLVVGSRFYHLYPLTNGIPAGLDAWAWGLNDSGTVVGQVGYGGPGTPRAYKFNRYGATALDGTTYSDFGQANGINADGDVVGRAVGPTGKARAVRWRSISGNGVPLERPPLPNAAPEDLGVPPGFADTHFEALAVNDRGQIVVNANFQTVAAHYALRWQDGHWQGLQDREWNGGEYQGWTVALGINSLGHIAGYSDGATFGYFAHAWIFDPHNEPELPSGELGVTDLHQRHSFDGPVHYGYSRATGVNDRGDVVGWRKQSRFDGDAHAFVVARNQLIDLKTRSEHWNGELKINNAGEIVAYDFSPGPGILSRPMVIRDDGLNPQSAAGTDYRNHRGFVLDELVLGGIAPFQSFVHVSAIQGSGIVAGTGRIGGVGLRPYLLVPASSPGNHPPVPRDDSVTRFTERVMVSVTERLLRNDTDPDPNEVLSLASYSPRTTNGGTVILQGDWLTYTPAGGFTGEDHFSYTITDNRGGLATANVVVRPENPRFIPPSGRSVLLSEAGTIPVLRFHGQAGKVYRIQVRDTLSSGNWRTVATLTASADGTLELLDPGAIFRDVRYYRVVE